MVKKQRKWETIKPGNLVCVVLRGSYDLSYDLPAFDSAKGLVTWIRITPRDLLLVLEVRKIPHYEPFAVVLTGGHRVEISLNHLELAKKE